MFNPIGSYFQGRARIVSTAISWTDETWTVVTGCSKVSAGCKHCYAEKLAPRLAAMGKAGYTALPWTAKNAAENVTVRPERLEQPLHWRKPRRIFVTSMGDLFHDLVPDHFIANVFSVIENCPRHIFQILTKRPERMAQWISGHKEWFDYAAGPGVFEERFSHVWTGTSVENQKAADERIPHLLRTPAAVRFLSCEPLLGEVNLTSIAHTCAYSGEEMRFNAFSDDVDDGLYFEAHPDGWDEDIQQPRCPKISWVIAGGESGPDFRPMDMDWARSLRDQARAAGVAFWFKQDSGIRPETNALLDGEEWHQFPVSFQGQTREKKR